MGAVADRDHERWSAPDVTKSRGAGSSQVETGPAAGGDGPGMDAVGGVGAGAVRMLIRELGPQRRSELGSGRVVGAHEQCPLRRSAPSEHELAERVAVEVDVAAATVPARPAAVDQADIFEHVEVVGEQVGRDVNQPLQLDRSAIGGGQFVDDGQSYGITQGGVAGAAEITMRVEVHLIRLSLKQN